ncbi:MAG: DivIVA domain-containing protein [Clostridiales bacterium]|nr:DivIVA domain-containing protein [Clostridiales bacterium]
MAITVKEIRNKQFASQRNGYNKDEVDDFLDELADQLEDLIKENLSLAKQLMERPAVESQPVFFEKPVEVHKESTPATSEAGYDEPSYFKNLETTLRETLINAQRVADETIAEARKKSAQMVAEAETTAASMLASAKADADAAKSEADELRKNSGEYRAQFLQLIENQIHLLNAEDILFK